MQQSELTLGVAEPVDFADLDQRRRHQYSRPTLGSIRTLPGVGRMEDQISDEELVDQHRHGDERAFARLVGRHQGLLYGYVLRLMRDSAAAEDIVQKTWVRVLRRLNSYNSQNRFSAWLFMIALNLVRDHARAQERRPDHGCPLPEYDLPERESAAQAEKDADIAAASVARCMEEREALRSLVDRLDIAKANDQVNYKAVLLLGIRQGMQVRMSISLGATNDLPESALPGGYSRSNYVDWLFPWSWDEEQASLKPGWPTLDEIWFALTRVIDTGRFSLNGIALVDALQHVFPNRTPSYNTWTVWRLRAKSRTIGVIGEKRWNNVLARWFPSRD